MQETRTLTIEYKVFTLADLERLAEVFEAAFQDSESKQGRAHLTFDVDLADCTSYTSHSPEILKIARQETAVSSIRIKAVAMEYAAYEEEKRAGLDLSPGSRSCCNRLTVRGKDSTWVDGFTTQVKDILNGVKPQRNLLARYATAVTFICMVVIALLFQWICHLALSQPLLVPAVSGESHNYSLFLSEFAFGLLVGWIAVRPLEEQLGKLWPSIQLRTHPQETTTP